MVAHLPSPARRPPRRAELTVNYRTPSEVMDVAARVLAVAAPDLTPSRSVRQAGTDPVFTAVDPRPAPAPSTPPSVEAARAERRPSPTGRWRSSPSPSMVERVDGALVRRAVVGRKGPELLDAPLAVLPVQQAKGLEFDSVVVVEPAAIVAEHPHGGRALYLALTRTTRRLRVVSSQPLPAGLAPAARPCRDRAPRRCHDGPRARAGRSPTGWTANLPPASSPGHVTWGIEPVGPLRGDVRISGSKNAVTKLMVAALLADTPSVVTNAPRLGDVDITAGMLRSLGAGVEIDGDRVTVDPTPTTGSRIPVSYTGLNRVPILMVGPLLHRIGEAFVPLVGGDRIGSRPVDYHVQALRQFGAEVELTDEGLEAKALRLHGAHFALPFPSVGATETVLMTAAVAEGRTILENAAVEPEVVELALLLQRMGARIELQPDRRFVIEGVSHLAGRHPTAGRRPHRGLLLPGGGPGHRRQGPHLGLRARTGW